MMREAKIGAMRKLTFMFPKTRKNKMFLIRQCQNGNPPIIEQAAA
jgi:hypothetical protein